MFIKPTQNWVIGNTVKVGFLSLKITGIIGNEYRLVSIKGVEFSFTPYKGLIKL